MISILPVEGLGEVTAGTALAPLITDAIDLHDGDIVVVTSKVVSKAEGRVVECDRDDIEAREALIRNESARVLRRRGQLFITETKGGLICANAGIDWSNVAPHHAVLLPLDPDRSARDIMYTVAGLQKVAIGVVISDTFGRVWRNGAVDVAIGCAGLEPIRDWRGQTDGYGNDLISTQTCTVDELAAAASLVMGKTAQIPVAVVRGADPAIFGTGTVHDTVVRSAAQDLFR